MSQASSQAAAFYREVAKNQVVWTIRDQGGFPALMSSGGQRAQPFWSSRSRVERIIAGVPAYAGFEPYQIAWEDFRTKWLPRLVKDGVNAGVNWSGKSATGYDLPPEVVRKGVEAAMANQVEDDLEDDTSEPAERMRCGATIPIGATRCPSCGWSYR